MLLQVWERVAVHMASFWAQTYISLQKSLRMLAWSSLYLQAELETKLQDFYKSVINNVNAMKWDLSYS